jgi:hypothetical protein
MQNNSRVRIGGHLFFHIVSHTFTKKGAAHAIQQ